MNKMVFALVGFVACAGLAYVEASDVTAAASDAGKIPAIVKGLGDGAVPSFAVDVMTAVCKSSVSPSRKIKQLVSVSEAFLGTTTPDSKSESVVEALVASVAPYTFFPEWVKLFKPTVDSFYENVSDEDYRKIVAGVLSKIDADKNVKDKVVVTAFTLLLMARKETPEEKEDWLSLVVIPASCNEQVRSVMPDVFRGNYDGLLGGEKVFFVRPVLLNDVTREGQENLDDESNVTRVGRPVPLTYRVLPKKHKKGKKHHHGSGDKSHGETHHDGPVPSPYSGQF